MTFKQRIVSAVGWSVAIKLSFQIVTWELTLLVIRILAPEDYGLMTVAQVFLNFMMGFSSLGFADALVQQEDTPKPVVARVFGVVLLVSLALTGLLALAAYPIAWWYQDARLVPLVQVSSLGFLFNAMTLLPRAYLMKTLRVRPMFLTELTAGLAGALTVAALAFTGWGVWALMLGWLVGIVARTVGLLLLAGEYLVWPRLGLEGVRPLFAFGAFRVLEHTVWMVFTSLDVLIIGHFLGPAALGVYAVALNFAMMPLSKIAPIVNSTAFPAFAMVQARPAEARFYALKALRLMAAVAVPVFFGIAATAPEIVDIVFGPNWVAAKPVLGVLALATTLRAVLLVLPNYLQGIGDARAAFWCTATAAAVFPPAFAIGCTWGVVGVAYAWLAGYPVVYALNALVAARRGGIPLAALLAAPLRPIAAGALMGATVLAARTALPPDWPVAGAFALLVAVGVASYAAAILLLFRGIADELLALFRRPRAPATPAAG